MDPETQKEIDKLERQNLIASRAYDIGFWLFMAVVVLLDLKMFMSAFLA